MEEINQTTGDTKFNGLRKGKTYKFSMEQNKKCELPKRCEVKDCHKGFIPHYNGGNIDCEPCECKCHKEEVEEIPQFKDTLEQLDNLSIKPVQEVKEVCKHKGGIRGSADGKIKECMECGKPLVASNPTSGRDWEEEVRVGEPWTQDGTAMLKRIKEIVAQARLDTLREIKQKTRDFASILHQRDDLEGFETMQDFIKQKLEELTE